MKFTLAKTFKNRALTLAAGLAALGFAAGPASALPITKTLTVDVYVICDDAGANCASTGPAGNAYFASEVDKIWAQAGINVDFNFVQNIHSTHFSFVDDNVVGDGFLDLVNFVGHGLSATQVDMFLTHTVAGAYGEGWFGAGGLLIAMDDVMAFNGGLGRIDTIAHELGHNFGLVQPAQGGDGGGHSPGQPSYLMASGGIRNVPATLANIAPDGLGLDFLPADQIAYARQSSLLHDVPLPEPDSFALFGLGLLGLAATRRRASANRPASA